MKANIKAAATLLLDLFDYETKQPIELGQMVKIHNWGMTTSEDVISYGHFDWDSDDRQFVFRPHQLMNISNMLPHKPNIDNSDLFKTSPAFLNVKELKQLNSLK